ncbi:MAG: hypothetical protein M3464_01825 [Chloroflexota bacterium]|nr:hypothetical protein [Chloroflexota bacterium]
MGSITDGDECWDAFRRRLVRVSEAHEPTAGNANPVRLLPGSFANPKLPVEEFTLHRLFLDALADVEPRVLADLANDPLTAFRRAWAKPGDHVFGSTPFNFDPVRQALDTVVNAELDQLEPANSDQREPRPGTFPYEIAMWGIRWRLNAWFIHDAGMYTAVSWLLNPPSETDPPAFRYPYYPVDWMFQSSPRFRVWFNPCIWAPMLESRAEAYARCLAEFERLLKTEMDQVEEWALDAGLTRAPIKRTGDEHFRWLVRYHISEESYASIARSVHLSRQSVKSAVQNAAQSVLFNLRAPDPPGRRRSPHSAKPRIVRVDRSAA